MKSTSNEVLFFACLYAKSKASSAIDSGYEGHDLRQAVSQQIDDSDNLQQSLRTIDNANVPIDKFISAYELKNNAKTIRAANGKVVRNTTQQTISYINSLGLSKREKAALYTAIYPDHKRNPFK